MYTRVHARTWSCKWAGHTWPCDGRVHGPCTGVTSNMALCFVCGCDHNSFRESCKYYMFRIGAVYTAITPPCTWAVYTVITRPCAWPITRPSTRSCIRLCTHAVTMAVYGPCSRVHGHVRAVYTCIRPVYTALYTAVYTCTQPCTRPSCTRWCTRPCTLRCTRPYTRVHCAYYTALHTDRIHVHNRVHGCIEAVYTDRTRVDNSVHDHIQAVYTGRVRVHGPCTRPLHGPAHVS